MTRKISLALALLIGLFFLLQIFMFYKSAEYDPSFLEAMSGDVFSDIFPKEWKINLDLEDKVLGGKRRSIRQKDIIFNAPITINFRESKHRYSPDASVEIGFFKKNFLIWRVIFSPSFYFKKWSSGYSCRCLATNYVPYPMCRIYYIAGNYHAIATIIMRKSTCDAHAPSLGLDAMLNSIKIKLVNVMDNYLGK